MKVLTPSALVSLLFALSLSAQALASSSSTYVCTPSDDNSLNDTFTVKVSAKKMTMQTEGETEQHPLIIDPTYKPKANKDYLRFRLTGNDSFLTGGESYSLSILVTKSMTTGEAKGAMKIQASGEGFFNNYFSCVKK